MEGTSNIGKMIQGALFHFCFVFCTSVVVLVLFPTYEGNQESLSLKQLQEMGSVSREESIKAEAVAREEIQRIKNQTVNKQNFALLVKTHLLINIHIYSIIFIACSFLYFRSKPQPFRYFLGGSLASWLMFFLLFH